MSPEMPSERGRRRRVRGTTADRGHVVADETAGGWGTGSARGPPPRARRARTAAEVVAPADEARADGPAGDVAADEAAG